MMYDCFVMVGEFVVQFEVVLKDMNCLEFECLVYEVVEYFFYN